MRKTLEEIQIKSIIPASTGVAVFLGTKAKNLMVFVDPIMGQQILFAYQQKTTTRPLTFDLLHNILDGFQIFVKCIAIVDVKENIFFARIILEQKSSKHIQLVEVDARPSDALLLALTTQKPIYIEKSLLDKLPDIPTANTKTQDHDTYS